jgi:muramidase (phage lysozyme)
MKAPLSLNSAIEKLAVVLAFLPLLFMIYPEFAAAAYTAQNDQGKALVFEIDSKQKTEPQLSTSETEVNPTLGNPCYPGPIGSCNPDTSAAQQPIVRAQTEAEELAHPGYSGETYSKETVEQLIVQYSAVYGIDPATPKCIAFKESGYNQFSKNRKSTASGVFQYLTSTWKQTDEGKAGMNVFDAEANVKAAIKYMAVHNSTQPWMVRSMCPKVSFTK